MSLRPRSPGTTRAVAVGAAVAVLGVTPFAVAQTEPSPRATAAAGEGRPVQGGVRNPGTRQDQSYTRETQIIADNSSYGTRQSNKGEGGGAIYGCRSRQGGTPANNEPCLRTTNLADGLAFELESRGPLAGTITAGRGGDGTRPFTTNATGVATGLNADRVDGQDAAQIVAAARQTAGLTAADAQTLGGQPPRRYTTRWALVGEDGQIVAQSGGFTVTTAYPGGDGPSGNQNVYIDSGEDVTDNGLTATIAVQNAVDGQAASFGGEVAVGACGSTAIACAPPGTENASTIVVTPRDSAGATTVAGERKRFYVTVTG
jgi:hypothetical protein